MHHGKVEKGLYPLKSLEKQVCFVTKPSQARWHSHLGHPSLQIVRHVLGHNNLPVSNESFATEVCDAYQQGKNHQLPYPTSVSVSTVPLELVFSDVWGPAPESMGRKSII
jgi:hypothetical protein